MTEARVPFAYLHFAFKDLSPLLATQNSEGHAQEIRFLHPAKVYEAKESSKSRLALNDSVAKEMRNL